MAQTEIRRGYSITIRSRDDMQAGNAENAPLESVPGAAAAADENLPDEVLTIDERTVPYTASPDGYNIYYMPTEKSLLEAARKFVDTQPEKQQ